MSASIELNFYKLYSQSIITKFELPFGKIQEYITKGEYKYQLPDDLFKYNKEKTTLTIKLYPTEKGIESEGFEFIFYVYKSDNHVYIQTDYLFKTVFELILQIKDDIKIEQAKQIIFIKLDSFDNKYRKRLTLINTDPSIVINNIKHDLKYITGLNYKGIDHIFVQISVNFDTKMDKNHLFIIKKIKKPDIENTEYIDFWKNNKKVLSDMMSEFENILFNEKTFITRYGNLRKQDNSIFEIKVPLLTKDNDYLYDLFKEKGLDLDNLEFFFNIYFVKFILNAPNFRTILCDQKLLLAIYQKAKKDLSNLQYYNLNIIEKIRILSTLFLTYSMCKTIEDFQSLNAKYYLFSEIKEKTIIYKVNKFIESFIDSLNEDSKLFSYLLHINSGIGFCKGNKVYTFDMTNVQMMKNHLKTLFPKFIIIYHLNSDDTGIAFYSDKTGGIAMNEYYMFKGEYNDLDYNSNDLDLSEKKLNEIAMTITLYFFHELFGHKKFSFSEEGGVSPKKVIKNNKIIELKYIGDFDIKDKKNEYILTSKISKGDSVHYLELAFNKFNYTNIFKLLIEIPNKGKLIDKVDWFIDSLEELEKYVILREIAKNEGKEFKFDEKTKIEDELTCMSKDIDIDKYKEENEKLEEVIAKIYASKKKSNQIRKFIKSNDKKDDSEIFSENKNKINIEESEDDESEEKESDEDEKIENIKDIKMKKIIKKFKLKFNDELQFEVEKKLNEKGISDEDYEELYYIYKQYLIKF